MPVRNKFHSNSFSQINFCTFNWWNILPDSKNGCAFWASEVEENYFCKSSFERESPESLFIGPDLVSSFNSTVFEFSGPVEPCTACLNLLQSAWRREFSGSNFRAASYSISAWMDFQCYSSLNRRMYIYISYMFAFNEIEILYLPKFWELIYSFLRALLGICFLQLSKNSSNKFLTGPLLVGL